MERPFPCPCLSFDKEDKFKGVLGLLMPLDRANRKPILLRAQKRPCEGLSPPAALRSYEQVTKVTLQPARVSSVWRQSLLEKRLARLLLLGR